MAKYMTKSTTVERVDPETGEVVILETTKDFKMKTSPERFYMVFFEKMASFYGIKNLSDAKVLIYMCELAEYNTGLVRMSKATRQEIVEKTGVNYTNLSKNMKSLVKLGLLIESNRDYIVNPEVFWKGDLKARTEQLEAGGIKFNITLYANTDF